MKDSTSRRDPASSDKTAGQIDRRKALKTIAGAAAAVGGLTQLSSPSAKAAVRSDTTSLALLDKMAEKPTSLAMQPRITYLGGPTYLIEIGQFRIISDPGFDPQGTQRNEGPGHLLTKVMEPPIPVDQIGPIDLALVSHAQHLDNLR